MSEASIEPSVLLVDDSADNLEMMQRMLRRLNIDLVLASSGREALAITEHREFAVILMDVQMPVLSGLETAEILRKNTPEHHNPIIFVTAHSADDSLIRNAYTLGAVDFISKPINFNILRAKVSFFVDFFRNNKMVQLQAQQLLEKERKERKLVEERKTLEEHGSALARLVKELQQANEALDSFASIVSHDLQEPLRGVVALSQLLEQRVGKQIPLQEKELLSTVVSEGQRMQQMIRDLLTLARVGTDDSMDVSVSSEEGIKTTLCNLQQSISEADATISYDELPDVLCHPAHIVQLLQNLIGNAIKFRSDHAPHIHISAVQEGSFWHFQVQDNGIGIPVKFAERIFVPFRRLHSRNRYPGTGIGLAICQKIVEKRGGKIWVESEPGKGSTFHFLLPAA